MTTKSSYRRNGFTLIELAFVVAIIALLIGTILVPLKSAVEQRQISDTQKTLDEIKEALIGFAVVNGRLPCPDKMTGAGANDGFEDPPGGPCGFPEGNLPWATLGVNNADAWGDRFHYRVSPSFSDAPITLTSSPNVDVTCPATACTPAYTMSTAAVVLSYGKNGWGGVSAATGVAKAAPTSADELENADQDANFVSKLPTEPGSVAGEFDDIVVWLSTPVLMNRMVTAGKLP